MLPIKDAKPSKHNAFRQHVVLVITTDNRCIWNSYENFHINQAVKVKFM